MTTTQLNESIAGEGTKGFVDTDTDLIEYYFAQGMTDGLPVVPPTPQKIADMIEALGGEADFIECRIPPRWGELTREVLAINMVMAGCLPSYAPVVRSALLALADNHFNLNGVQATTHVACPLLIVNGPVRNTIDMNAGHNLFGSGNRANATIGRAVPTSSTCAGRNVVQTEERRIYDEVITQVLRYSKILTGIVSMDVAKEVCAVIQTIVVSSI